MCIPNKVDTNSTKVGARSLAHESICECQVEQLPWQQTRGATSGNVADAEGTDAQGQEAGDALYTFLSGVTQRNHVVENSPCENNLTLFTHGWMDGWMSCELHHVVVRGVSLERSKLACDVGRVVMARRASVPDFWQAA